MILLAGATGYIGRELLHLLERRGCRVRCMVRRPGALQGRVAGTTEIVAGDVFDAASLQAAFRGVDTAYYLVHSMSSPGEFEREDRLAYWHLLYPVYAFIFSGMLRNIVRAVADSVAEREASGWRQKAARSGDPQAS